MSKQMTTNTDNSTIQLHTANSYNTGFTIRFSNGIVASVRFGEMNYSDGKTTAECAAICHKTGEFVRVDGFDYDGDDVLPHLNADQVAKFISAAANHKG